MIILDEIHDPFNLGAIIRNCIGLGYKAIILKKNRQAGITPIVDRVSAGSLSKCNIYFVTNLSQVILKLKDNNYYIVGTTLDKEATNIFKVKQVNKKEVYIFGNENKGIHQNILNKCDLKIYYPIQDIQSLNVSSSVGVILGYFNYLSNDKG